MAGSTGDVVLLDSPMSAFGMRVRIALAEKGVEYEYREENLTNKSSLLLKMNPVYKKIPVLIHNGKPVCESNIIVQYIDETWHHNDSPPLLPSDPHLRAQARFWADFVDKKLYECAKKIWMTKGDDQQVAKSEFIENLKILEMQLGEKPYLIGETFGYADIAMVTFSCLFYTVEMIGNMSIEKECPKLDPWVQRCKQRESVSKSLHDPHKLYEFVLELLNKQGNQ